MNRVLLYKRKRQWSEARENLRRIFDDFFQREQMGETEIFVKLLGFNDGKISAHEWIEQNRAFIGGKTRAQWLNPSDQQYVPFAYENLGRYYLKHACIDQAHLCYQEILQGEINVDVSIKSSCFEGIANTCEKTGEYNEAMIWLKNVIDLDLNGASIHRLLNRLRYDYIQRFEGEGEGEG